MPTQEEALSEFFRSFRSSMNMLSLYSYTHPFFAESVKDLKNKTDVLLSQVNTLKIGITNDSLLIEGKSLDKSGFYDELARSLHRRKIKNIEIRSGVSTEELIAFLSKIHLPPKQILSSGGLGNMLKKENIAHVTVEELDYSQLLRDGGEECKDIWSYLLKEAVEQRDAKKMGEFADNASSILSNFKTKDFAEDAELKANISHFLDYLKSHHKEKFDKFAKEMLRVTLNDKTVPDKDMISQVKVLFKDLSEHDFADTISEEILEEKGFDTLTFNVFSQLADENKHKVIASSLKDKIRNNESLLANIKIRQKVERLFAIPGTSSVSEIYRNTLQSFIKDISFNQGSLTFDRNHLSVNYRLILLYLFGAENTKEKLQSVTERIINELGSAMDANDTGYLKSLIEILKRRKREEPYLIDLFIRLDDSMAGFVENNIGDSKRFTDFEYLIDYLPRSVKGEVFYLDKIFLENQLNPLMLKFFLKLFSADLKSFYERLNKKYTDLEFLGNMINCLRAIDSELSLEILKNIYSSSNNIIKIEIIRALADSKKCDEGFLFAVLEEEALSLRKEALAILAKHEKLKTRALEALFSVQHRFGRNNSLLAENIMAVDELGIKEARAFLVSLSQKRFFWNRDIKKLAQDVLRRWDAGKD